MKCFSRFGIVLGLLVPVFLLSSCIPKPPLHRYGNLRLTIALAEEAIGAKAQASDIRLIKIKLTHKDDQLVKEDQCDFTGSDQEVAFTGLFPGEWRITVSGLDSAGKGIFTGTTDTRVEPEEVKTVQLTLKPAPGTLRAVCDISHDPALALQSKGTLYVYIITDTGKTTKSVSMVKDGDWFRAVTDLAEGTYQVKIAIPNTTYAVFESAYSIVNIRAGYETILNISANSSMKVIGIIDSSPGIPGGLTAVYNRESGEVQITWDEGTEPDLEGYHLYRTDEDGRIERLIINQSTNVSPPITDTVEDDDFYNGRIGYAVSSFDHGGNESFWSEFVYILK